MVEREKVVLDRAKVVKAGTVVVAHLQVFRVGIGQVLPVTPRVVDVEMRPVGASAAT